MMTLKIFVQYGPDQKWHLEVPAVINGEQLLIALIKRGKLPATDHTNFPFEYHVRTQNHERIGRNSLKNAGVQNGDTLFIYSVIYAASKNQ